MYYDFFGFREPPFSIAPDPRYLYLSERHKEALAHLMYGVDGQGGFIIITGEVGTGKTTISRCFIENVPSHVDIALILNPKLSARELLSSICDELGIQHPAGASIKRMIDLINTNLLDAHAAGRHKVLMIDEAQNLSAEVLEQLRLLTNLETAEKKLLQIVLLGQPELQDILAQNQLRQLSQRVTARYHLHALERSELPAYLRYRLSVAGQRSDLFTAGAVKALYRRSGGVPRLINLISDRALLGAYSQGEQSVDAHHVKSAAKEVLGPGMNPRGLRETKTRLGVMTLLATVTACLVVLAALFGNDVISTGDEFFFKAGTGPVEQSVAAEAVNSEEAPEETPDISTDATPEPETSELANGIEENDLSFDLATDSVPLADAFQSLFGVWGINYQPRLNPIACEFAETESLSCLYKTGNWRSMMLLNHPVILSLVGGDGEKTYVTLITLAGDVATIASRNGPREVAIEQLEQHWLGEYTLLWRMPPYMTQASEIEGVMGKQLWLSSQLMQVIRPLSSGWQEQERVEAMTLDDQVRWYQQHKGLKPDGIAGAMTLIQISNDLNPGRPRLIPNGGEG
ncbi:ExeA family protein [Marinobacter caseinilyticus]|uniref:ExeA family protein n=1 Tax=Marinobacter caseinilyticus TaxID=2692195 RepID=UPI00140ABD1A|nr:ExeA family protein [Marinobacter caseinilyticus]